MSSDVAHTHPVSVFPGRRFRQIYVVSRCNFTSLCVWRECESSPLALEVSRRCAILIDFLLTYLLTYLEQLPSVRSASLLFEDIKLLVVR